MKIDNLETSLVADEITLTQLMSKPMDSLDNGNSVGSVISSGHGSFSTVRVVKDVVGMSSGPSKYIGSSSTVSCVWSMVLCEILLVLWYAEVLLSMSHSIRSKYGFKFSFFVRFFSSIIHDKRQSQMRSFSVE